MLSSLQNNSNFSTILSQYGSFAYDGVFNLTSLSASIPGATSQGGASTFTYDTKDRLTQEASARNGGYTGNFGYDTAGNPTTFKGASQTFNSDNQRSASGFVFDGNGNPTTYSGTSLSFDPESHLSSIGSNWSASYRADGLRAKKTVGSSSTYYLYDGGEPVVELDSSGNVQAINVFAPDGLVARKQGGVWTQYAFDQQGNVAQRLDSSASVTSSSIYDAYGVESTTGTPTDPFGYNARWGYLLDRDTGLYLCQHRYYDAAAGRWVNRDPIGYSGGIGLYGYCAGHAIGAADSLGLLTAEDVGAGLLTSAIALGHGLLGGLDVLINGGGQGIPGYLINHAIGMPQVHLAGALDPYMDRPGAGVSEVLWAIGGLADAGAGICEGFAGMAEAGTPVYRLFGGESAPYGHSWTTVNPDTLENPRASLGLPDVNTGEYAIEGRLSNPKGVIRRPALPYDGNPGGAPELLVPDPESQIIIISGGGYHPPRLP
jgi:RHS repeat-associated protein